jgi:thioredoxin-like negative regulator of GroEL
MEEEKKHSPVKMIQISDAAEIDMHLKEAGTEQTVLIQFTAQWCRRCGTLKEEIADRFDSTVRWIVVDIDAFSGVQERFNVSTMPRVDVYRGGRTESVEGFDAKIDEIAKMVSVLQTGRPEMQLVDDF